MSDPNLFAEAPHDAAEELLPWYATGQLDEGDRTRVERHLLDCAECREQLTLERRLVDGFQSIAPEIESGWARLRGRIEPRRPGRGTAPRPPLGFWAALSRPAIAGLAVAQLAFVILAGGVLLALSRPAYHVLGSAPEPAAANVIVIFRAEASERGIREALKAAGASIVGGPSAADAYLLNVAPQQRQAAVARLQADADVELAQPVDGSAP